MKKLLWSILAAGCSLTLTAASPVMPGAKHVTSEPMSATHSISRRASVTTAVTADENVISEKPAVNAKTPRSITEEAHRVMARPARTKAYADGSQGTISFKIAQPTDATIAPLLVSALCYDEEYQEWSVAAYAEIQQTDFSQPIASMMPSAPGTYPLFCVAYQALENGRSTYLYYTGEVTVDGDVTVDVDFSKCVNKIQITAMMGDGQPFPETDDTDAENITLAVGSFYFHGLGLSTRNLGTPEVYALCNNFTDDVEYSASIDYFNWDDQYGSEANGHMSGPFTESSTGVIPMNWYHKLTDHTSLSAKDLAINARSKMLNDMTLQRTNLEGGMIMIDQNQMLSCVWNSAFSATDLPYTLYCTKGGTYGSGDVSGEVLIGSGRLAYYLDDNNPAVYKTSGLHSFAGDKEIVVGNIYDTGAPSGISYLSPIPEYNIDPQEQEIVNFLNPIYFRIDPMMRADTESGTFSLFVINANGYGPFNESLQFQQLDEFLTIKYNGNEVTLDDLSDVAYSGTLDFKVSYPDGWIQNQFSAPLEADFHIALGTDDYKEPEITGYQILDADGKTTGNLVADRDARLMISVTDLNQYHKYMEGYTVKIEVAAEETDDWNQIDCATEFINSAFGTLYSVDPTKLALPTDVWHKVRITATDAAGNYSVNTLRYCFNIAPGSSVEGIDTDASAESGAIYYNLQGIRVANPENGIYIRVTGSRSTKIRL